MGKLIYLASVWQFSPAPKSLEMSSLTFAPRVNLMKL